MVATSYWPNVTHFLHFSDVSSLLLSSYLYMPMCTFVVRCLSHPMNVIKTRMQTTINTVSSATPAAPSTASPYSAATTSNSASTGGAAKPRIIPYRRMPVDLTKKTTLGAFKHILEYEGIRGLYAGFGMAIWGLAIGPVYLTSVEKTKSFLYNSTDLFHKNRTSVLPFDVVPFLSGASASVVSQLMGVPLDVIQNNQMKQDSAAIGGHRRRRALDVIREVREKSGISGFYRGYWVTLMQNAPMSALVWFTFAEIHPRLSKLPIAAKQWISTISSTSPSTALTPPPSSTPIIPPSITLPPTIHHHSPTPPLNTSSLSTTFPSSSSSSVSSSPHLSSHHDHLPGKWDVTELGVVFVSAALAGGFASVMTLPLDVLRTRLQTSMNPNATVVSTFHDIRQQRGWSGFMSGSRPRLFGQAMSAATLMTVYEILKRVCLREDDQHDGHKHQHV